MLQRENRTEEQDPPQTSRAQANITVPSPPYYEDYYEQCAEEPANQPMDINMLFHPKDSMNMANYFPPPLESDSFLIRREEDKMQEEAIFLEDEQPFDLSPTQLRMVSDNIIAEVRRKYELRPSQG